MAGKQVAGDGFSSNLTGLSKSQLYDVMSRMKILVEQNQQQARQLLVQNPLMTRGLFQGQIMLGMVQPPQSFPSIQSAASQDRQQSTQLSLQSNTPAAPSLPGHVDLKDQTGASQTSNLARKQQQSQPMMSTSSVSVPPSNIQSQSFPSHPSQSAQQQPRGHFSAQSTSMPPPTQSSQLPNMPPLPLHSASHTPPLLQPPMPPASLQLQQQPVQASGIPHMPLQPPLPPQPRPPSMPGFPHQLHSQMGSNAGFQPHSGAPQLHHSVPMFHADTRPPANMGPSFPQGQTPFMNQPPHRSIYQGGGSHLGPDFNQTGSSMQPPDRGSGWMPGGPDSMTQHPGPPLPLIPGPGQMGPGNQPPRPPPLSPEMEKELLMRVISLTPEQINLLPPEQRGQVLQLQQMLRQ